MRVLLAQPPLIPAGPVVPPVGLCSLASFLIHHNEQVRILDLDLEMRPRTADLSSGIDRLLRCIDEFDPAVVAVTSMYSNSLQAMRLIGAAKRHRPTVVTVAGGSHFGAMGVESLRRIPELDFVVEGEGEPAFLALVRALETGGSWRGIPSLCYRSGTEACANAADRLIDLAALPAVWSTIADAIDISRYASTTPADAPFRMMYLEAGRGCPFSCSFCATAPFWRRKYRVKPVERLVEEIRYLHEEFDYGRFILVHDLLTVNRDFISHFCDAMLAARMPVEWMANSRTDIRLEGLLPKMKAAGCWKLFMGVESGSPRIQKTINKDLDIDQACQTVGDLASHGITATCSFVIGFPDETREEIASSIEVGSRLRLIGAETVQFHRLRLWPPAPMASEACDAQFDLDSLLIEYPYLEVPNEDVEAIQGDSRFFAGYFVPASSAGLPSELAQIEMFFHHAIALAPLTMAALGQFSEGRLVDLFCEVTNESGGIHRRALDWDEGRFYGNWLAILPIIRAMSNKLNGQRDGLRLVSEVLRYEERRIEFVTDRWRQNETALVKGDNWAAYRVNIDVPATIEILRGRRALDATLLVAGVVVFVKRSTESFAVFHVEEPLVPRLVRRDEEVIHSLLH